METKSSRFQSVISHKAVIRKANGVWIWAVLLTVLSIGQCPSLMRNLLERNQLDLGWSADHPIGSHGWAKIACVIWCDVLFSLLLCMGWLILSSRLRRRSPILQIFGFVLFGLGTLSLLNAVNETCEGLAILSIGLAGALEFFLYRFPLGFLAIVAACWLTYSGPTPKTAK